MIPPAPLPENAGLAFLGESAWLPARLTDREAQRLLTAANACGRPNADVLRRRLSVVNGQPKEGWQIDFPEHFTVSEAALYEQPFAILRQRTGGDWQNPAVQPGLRRALARLTRWLALPADATAPDWRWIEDDLLPDASLLVVARDDDFTHGVLTSQVFACWQGAWPAQLGPLRGVASFPFPWPPTTALGALTAMQEEQRHAIARAVRTGDRARLEEAVFAAYGWPTGSADPELLNAIRELARQRVGR